MSKIFVMLEMCLQKGHLQRNAFCIAKLGSVEMLNEKPQEGYCKTE